MLMGHLVRARTSQERHCESKECFQRTQQQISYSKTKTEFKKVNLRGTMDDLGLGPSFHVLVFIYNPHSSFHVFLPHKTFVKRQVMAYSVLLIQLSSCLYIKTKKIFAMQQWKYKRSWLVIITSFVCQCDSSLL